MLLAVRTMLMIRCFAPAIAPAGCEVTVLQSCPCYPWPFSLATFGSPAPSAAESP